MPITREEKNARKRAWYAANKERIQAAKKLRYATDAEYREQKLEAGKEYRERWATGFGRGRPRADEVRPVSKLAEMNNRYRDGNEQWKAYNRTKQAEWVAANPERRAAIQRAYRARVKARLAV